MARTVVVTKKAVTFVQSKLYHITLNLQYKEDAIVLLDQDFTQRYRTGDVIANKVAAFTVAMQAAIDNYKAQENIFNAPLLDTAVTNIQAGLTV